MTSPIESLSTRVPVASVPIKLGGEGLGSLSLGEQFDWPGIPVPLVLLHNGKIIGSNAVLRIYEALGAAFSLIAFEGADTSKLEHSAESCALPLVVIRVALRPHHFHHALVLVRPDHHIAWSASVQPEHAQEIIDTIRGMVPVD